MKIESTEWRPLAANLVQTLTAGGHLTDPGWRDAFERTPRHVFVPEFYRIGPNDNLISADDPLRRGDWLRGVYADEALLTQRRNSHGGAAGVPTSSSSSPSAMAIMLDRLNLRDGAGVLEIGTGTGYNAALLCHRLGAEGVTSIELDPGLTELVAERLAEMGHHPTLVIGDGEAGVPERAPYDAIIATCALPFVPPAWIEQLTVGGRLVMPFGARFGGLAVLTKTDETTVEGGFDTYAVWFMPMRPIVDEPGGPLDLFDFPDYPPVPYESLTDLDPRQVLVAEFQSWLELHLAPVRLAAVEAQDDIPAALLVHTEDGYARIDTQPRGDGAFRVRQFGRRRPWDTIEAAWRGWNRHGRPARTRLGIRAVLDPPEQYVWLDSPVGDIAWPMPAG